MTLNEIESSPKRPLNLLLPTIRGLLICKEDIQLFSHAIAGHDVNVGHEDELGEGGAAGEVAHVGLGVGVDRAPRV